MAQGTGNTVTGSQVTARILWAFAVAFVLTGLAAGIFLEAAGITAWLEDGYHFLGVSGVFGMLFLLTGAGINSAALFIAGILLRATPRPWAPTASFVLSLFALLHVFVFVGIMLGSLGEDDKGFRQPMAVIGVLSLIVLWLPPFLHWRRARLLAQTREAAAGRLTP